MKELTKEYCIQETELCILLALKGMQTLYGVRLSSAESMTRETLCRCLFAMQKKGIVGRPSSSDDAFWIEENMDECAGLIQAASRFIVLADADEQIPERYFYVAGDTAVMLQPAGQQGGAFHMKKISKEAMWAVIGESGLGTEEEAMSVPEDIRREAQGFWQEDKDAILLYPAVKGLLQEYDVRTQCREKQRVRLVHGLDAYLVCGDGLGGGEES